VRYTEEEDRVTQDKMTIARRKRDAIEAEQRLLEEAEGGEDEEEERGEEEEEEEEEESWQKKRKQKNKSKKKQKKKVPEKEVWIKRIYMCQFIYYRRYLRLQRYRRL
jgi:hypothetical protein